MLSPKYGACVDRYETTKPSAKRRLLRWHALMACDVTFTTAGELYNTIRTKLRAHCVHVVDFTLRFNSAISTFNCAFFVRAAVGSYLLSGGLECVLVKWTYSDSTRDTKPRLGAPLCGVTVSPDGTLYATCHQDNCKSNDVAAHSHRLCMD